MHYQRNRLLGSLLGVGAAAVLLAGCGGGQQAGAPAEQPPAQEEPAEQAPGGQEPGEQESGQPEPGEQAPPEQEAPEPGKSSGTYEPYREGANAVTYDSAQVPAGARVELRSEPAGERTKLTASLQGLQPNREYGAHIHTKPCGPTGQAAGPHFQEKADPVKPSVDPAYANPENEVWLDFRTDAEGNATSETEGAWSFEQRDDAKSFVIHEKHTMTEPGQAGEAGGRLACLNVDL